MKKMIVMLGLLLASVVNAGEIKLHSFNQSDLWMNRTVTQEFQINPELERAWISIKVFMNDPDGAVNPDEYRVKIPGLTFNKHTGVISIDFEGRITDCAILKTTGRWIFRSSEIKMTSECKFEGRWKDIITDDGFEIKKSKKYEIYLIIE